MKKYKILGWNPIYKIVPSWDMEYKMKFPQTGKGRFLPTGKTMGNLPQIMLNTKIGRRWFWAGWFIWEKVEKL